MWTKSTYLPLKIHISSSCVFSSTLFIFSMPYAGCFDLQHKEPSFDVLDMRKHDITADRGVIIRWVFPLVTSSRHFNCGCQQYRAVSIQLHLFLLNVGDVINPWRKISISVRTNIPQVWDTLHLWCSPSRNTLSSPPPRGGDILSCRVQISLCLDI